MVYEYKSKRSSFTSVIERVRHVRYIYIILLTFTSNSEFSNEDIKFFLKRHYGNILNV